MGKRRNKDEDEEQRVRKKIQKLERKLQKMSRKPDDIDNDDLSLTPQQLQPPMLSAPDEAQPGPSDTPIHLAQTQLGM